MQEAEKRTSSQVEIDGLAPGAVSVSDAVAAPQTKVKFSHKATIFIASVISLSWFFEGWRDIHKDSSPAGYAILVAGTLLTVGLLGVYAYWMYFEEKSKGTLKRRITLFESINQRLSNASLSNAGSAESSVNCCHQGKQGEGGHRG